MIEARPARALHVPPGWGSLGWGGGRGGGGGELVCCDFVLSYNERTLGSATAYITQSSEVVNDVSANVDGETRYDAQ